MILAEIYPRGYLVAQAWRKWFDGDEPPFSSFEELNDWGTNWVKLVQHDWPNIRKSYGQFETSVLGFKDDPKFNSVASRNLWENGDNQLLQQITAERASIAKALGVNEHNAGLFVLTGWLMKEEFQRFWPWLLEAGEQRAYAGQFIRKAMEGDAEAMAEVQQLAQKSHHVEGEVSQCAICRQISIVRKLRQAEPINDPLSKAVGYAEALLEFSELKTAEYLEALRRGENRPTPKLEPLNAIASAETGECVTAPNGTGKAPIEKSTATTGAPKPEPGSDRKLLAVNALRYGRTHPEWTLDDVAKQLRSDVNKGLLKLKRNRRITGETLRKNIDAVGKSWSDRGKMD